MKLMFLGTRGEIEARTPRHYMHSSLLISYRGAKVMIDCGLDWLGRFERLRPDAIVLTHAHPGPRLGLEKRRLLPGACAAKNMADVERLRHRQSSTNQGTHAHEYLRHHIRGVPSRALDSGSSRRVPRERRPSAYFLRAGSRVHP